MNHRGLLKRAWILPALIAILIIAHGFVFYSLSSHMTLAMVLGLVLLVLLKHVGLFGSIYAALKRRSKL